MVEHLENAGIHLTNDEHAARLSDYYECAYLVVNSGKTVGMLKYRELEEKFDILQLQIHPKNQGKGLGKMIMDRVLSWSDKENKKIELTVLKANPARSLYEKLGFSIVGEDDYEFHMQFKPSGNVKESKGTQIV